MNNYVLSASRLMTAGEVKALCADMKSNRSLLIHQEIQAKSVLSFPIEKAASAVTLTA